MACRGCPRPGRKLWRGRSSGGGAGVRWRAKGCFGQDGVRPGPGGLPREAGKGVGPKARGPGIVLRALRCSRPPLVPWPRVPPRVPARGRNVRSRGSGCGWDPQPRGPGVSVGPGAPGRRLPGPGSAAVPPDFRPSGPEPAGTRVVAVFVSICLPNPRYSQLILSPSHPMWKMRNNVYIKGQSTFTLPLGLPSRHEYPHSG